MYIWPAFWTVVHISLSSPLERSMNNNFSSFPFPPSFSPSSTSDPSSSSSLLFHSTPPRNVVFSKIWKSHSSIQNQKIDRIPIKKTPWQLEAGDRKQCLELSGRSPPWPWVGKLRKWGFINKMSMKNIAIIVNAGSWFSEVSLWMLRLLFSVRNVSRVPKVTGLWNFSLRVFSK